VLWWIIRHILADATATRAADRAGYAFTRIKRLSTRRRSDQDHIAEIAAGDWRKRRPDRRAGRGIASVTRNPTRRHPLLRGGGSAMTPLLATEYVVRYAADGRLAAAVTTAASDRRRERLG
jgi:hypothetical protein